ncbi:MAG: Hsp20/alpha crystallin family protein [Phycisphaerales bacterium]
MALPDLFRPSRALRHRGAESFMRPFDEMRRMMEDFWMTPFEEMGRWSQTFTPRVDVKEEDNHVVVSAELPGIDQKDIDVTVTRDSVRIAGEKKREEEKEERGYYRHETSYGSFERVIDLPSEVDENKADAEFSKGVLTIRLPKSEQARSKQKKVEIKSA